MKTFKQHLDEIRKRVAITDEERDNLALIYHMAAIVGKNKNKAVTVLLNTDENTVQDRPVLLSLRKKGLIQFRGDTKLVLTDKGLIVVENLTDILDRTKKVKKVPLKDFFTMKKKD